MSDYTQYEDAVTDALARKLEISRGDAQGLVEANAFYLNQGWCGEAAAEDVAAKIAAA